MSELSNLKFLEEFLDAHITFIVRDGRLNLDRAATISDLHDFIIENAAWLCEKELMGVLQDISMRMLKASEEQMEITQLKLENVFGMTGKVESEICIMEGKLDG